jgi:F420-dependent oxidoreductase-like protein
MPIRGAKPDADTVRIAANIGGESLGAPASPGDLVGQAVDAELQGFAAAWSVHFSRGVDALSVLAVAGSRTSRIDLGVGVVPTYPRHPLALAQQAATTQAFCSGRLTLGVGVSHRPVIEDLFGLPFTSPAAHMQDYLSVLGPLLNEGSVTHRGRYFAVDGGAAVPGTSPVSVVVGALGPRMVQVAGEAADGVVTWLAGPRSLGSMIVPTLLAAASAAGRPSPRVIAAIPIAVTDDLEAGTAAAEAIFARYGGLENYRRLFDREGVASVGELAVVGTEQDVSRSLQGFASAGVTELWAVPFAVGPDPGSSLRRTRTLLLSLAAETSGGPTGMTSAGGA